MQGNLILQEDAVCVRATTKHIFRKGIMSIQVKKSDAKFLGIRIFWRISYSFCTKLSTVVGPVTG